MVDTTFKWAGTVSHGTLRPEDLIPKFGEALRDLSPRHWRLFVRDQSDDMQENVVQLMDLLDLAAPEGYHFGTHEGDGSDFGFWKDEDDNLDGVPHTTVTRNYGSDNGEIPF